MERSKVLHTSSAHHPPTNQTTGSTHISRIIESQPAIQPTNRLQLPLLQLKIRNLQILQQSRLVIALGNHSQSALGGPAEKDLSRRLLVRFGDLGDFGVLEEDWRVLGFVPAELEEGLGAEGGVGCDGDVLGGGELEEGWLDEVGVVLDLEGCGADFGVSGRC